MAGVAVDPAKVADRVKVDADRKVMVDDLSDRAVAKVAVSDLVDRVAMTPEFDSIF